MLNQQLNIILPSYCDKLTHVGFRGTRLLNKFGDDDNDLFYAYCCITAILFT